MDAIIAAFSSIDIYFYFHAARFREILFVLLPSRSLAPFLGAVVDQSNSTGTRVRGTRPSALLRRNAPAHRGEK